MRKISLLICGKVRDRAAFETDLEQYLKWLGEGVVERIVLSGWTSDLHSHSDLFASLETGGVDVVLSDEPNLKTPGYALHQTKSLYYGLSQFDADALVLKTRTDKVSWSLSCDIKALPGIAAAQRPVGPTSPFKERVLVMGSLLFQPFFISDQLFLGKAKDLKLLANYDLWYARDHCLLNTEQMLFYPAFRRQCPFTEAFFTINPGLQFLRRDLISDIYEFLLNQPLYLHALRESMMALESSFTLGLFGNNGACPGNVTWRDLLNDELSIPGTYVPADSGLRFGVSDKLPQALLDVPIMDGQLLTLRTLSGEESCIQHMRDETCADLFNRWPELPNVRVPNQVRGRLRVVSSRIPLVGT